MVSLLIIAALALAVLVLALSKYGDGGVSNRLVEKRSVPLTIPVQIVCGDCCGTEGSPRRTYLSTQGGCEQCGGYSYVLASTFAVGQLRAWNNRLREVQQKESTNKVVPIRSRRNPL